jgi:hypothetical protein
VFKAGATVAEVEEAVERAGGAGWSGRDDSGMCGLTAGRLEELMVSCWII